MASDILDKLKLCRLPGMQQSYSRITQEAKDQGWPLERYIETLVDEEILNARVVPSVRPEGGQTP